MFQGMAPSPMLSGWAEVKRALGEFRLGSGQKWEWGPSDTGLPRINRPPSVPSPGLLPAASRMSVSSPLLCLNSVWDDV